MTARLGGAVFRTFGSLAVRNYRLYFSGQVVSVTGTWMQQVAQMWLVLHLAGSAVALGVTAALQFTPMLLLGAWGGLVADRGDKRRLLFATQGASALLAAALAALTLTGAVRLWIVLVFALLLGLVNVVDNPTRQSFVSEMVGPKLLSNAVSLNSTTFTSARVLGPALAGTLIAAVGTGWCFALNAVSYAAVIGALALMRPADFHRGPRLARARGQVTEGLRYAWRTPQLRAPLLLMLVVATLAFNFNSLMPLFARYTFGGGPSTYGLLMSLMGLGALVGALVSAARARATPGLQVGAALAFGALLLCVALAPTLPFAMVALVPVGAAMVTLQATTNSLLQLASDPAFRGRVMALYVVVVVGSTPIGAPLMGLLAQHLGPRAALAGGAAAALAAGSAALVARLRPSREDGSRAMGGRQASGTG